MSDTIQSGRFYSLQEVSAQCGLAPYILRYWELHFPQFSADTGKPKHMYSVSDISLISRIKKLLYVEHLTIEQAKARLNEEMAFPVGDAAPQAKAVESTPEPVKAEEPKPEPAPVVETQNPQAVEPGKAPEPEVTEAEPAVEEPKVEEAAHGTHGDMPMDEIHRAAAEELASLRSLVESLRAELEEERGKAQNAQELLAAEVTKVLEVTQLLDAERSRSQGIHNDLTQSSDALAAKDAEIATLTLKLSDVQNCNADSQSALRAKIEELTSQNAALKAKLNNFVSELRSLSSVLKTNV